MDNRVAGCQPPAVQGRPPYLGLGCLLLPVWSGWWWLPGVHQGSIPSMLCVRVALVVAYVVGAVLTMGRGAVGPW